MSKRIKPSRQKELKKQKNQAMDEAARHRSQEGGAKNAFHSIGEDVTAEAGRRSGDEFFFVLFYLLG